MLPPPYAAAMSRSSLLVGTLVSAALLSACGMGRGATASPVASTLPPSRASEFAAASPSATVRLPAGGRVERETGQPIGVADVRGRPWFGLNKSGAVRTGTGALVEVGAHPLRLAALPDGSVWVSVFGDGALVHLSPAGSVLARVPLDDGGRPEGIAAADGVLWVVDEPAGEVVVHDASSGRSLSRVRVGDGPRLLVVGAEAVWVTGWADGSVTGVDRGSRRVSARRDGVCLGPQGVGEAGGLIWVACTLDGVVVALDPRDLAEKERLPLPDADALVVYRDRVVAVGQSGPTVLCINAAQQSRLREQALGVHTRVIDGNVAAAVVGGDLVVTHPEAAAVWTVPISSLC